ncbi:4-oxalocrotonate tautomerase [Streptomyces armeniacus]|uniref:4-oxalocrotonate tautomerase n=1 Tax=Streptomyces armeniacus TaxID=83291 RepID=A0A345XLI9_9ACTN|nr:tautomerase family protein [Streptomyces armeniacus]AXK32505.1 4-oxalocrotonate tautomerase [Streptomyces armeniacus]
MPQVSITIAEGRTPAQLRNLMHEVHAAVLRTTDTRPEYIRVVVHEVRRALWATGDLTVTERDAAETGRTGEHGGQAAAPRPVTPAADEEQS